MLVYLHKKSRWHEKKNAIIRIINPIFASSIKLLDRLQSSPRCGLLDLRSRSCYPTSTSIAFPLLCNVGLMSSQLGLVLAELSLVFLLLPNNLPLVIKLHLTQPSLLQVHLPLQSLPLLLLLTTPCFLLPDPLLQSYLLLSPNLLSFGSLLGFSFCRFSQKLFRLEPKTLLEPSISLSLC